MTQNTKNIKIIKKIANLCFVMFLGGGLAWILQGFKGVLSFEVAFFAFLGVFWSLTRTLRHRLQASQNAFASSQQDISPEADDEVPQEQEKFSVKFALGMGLSFSLLRLLAYGALVMSLIVLIEMQYFALHAYIAGIFIGMLCSIYFATIDKILQNKQNQQ